MNSVKLISGAMILKYNTNSQIHKHLKQQARKPRSYASSKLRPTDRLTDSLTGVKCRATSIAKNMIQLKPNWWRNNFENLLACA